MTEHKRERLSTIQKHNKLNEVFRYQDKGPGGAWHMYLIEQIESGKAVSIIFQNGPRSNPNSTHGVLDGDLLEIVRDRLRCFQAGDYACEENAQALRHVEEALMWMNKRAEDRAERNVLGTYQK